MTMTETAAQRLHQKDRGVLLVLEEEKVMLDPFDVRSVRQVIHGREQAEVRTEISFKSGGYMLVTTDFDDVVAAMTQISAHVTLPSREA